MTGKTFVNFIRSQTKTNSVTYTDDEIVRDANIVKDEIVAQITQINEDYFGMEAYRNLIAGQREYSLPDYVLNNIKYVEADIKGEGKHKHCEEFDLTRYERSTDEDQIIKQFQFHGVPIFDVFRNSLWFYTGDPIIDVFNGIRLWYIRYPDDITVADLSNVNADLSNDLVRPLSAGLPRQIHLSWATKVVVLYKNSKEKPIPLTQNEKNVETALAVALAGMSGLDLDRDQTATVPSYENGENY